MAEFEEDDDYRRRVEGALDPNSGIAGPGPDLPAAPAPAAAPSPYSSKDRDRIVQGWANSGTQFGNNRQGIEQYLGSLGASGQGWRVDRDDKVFDPNGRVYDWIGDVGTDRARKRTGYTTDSRYAAV